MTLIHDKSKICKGKIRYKSKKQAVAHLHNIQNYKVSHKIPVRAYKCEQCPYWHLTSKTIEEDTPGKYKPLLDWSKILAA